MIWLLLGCSEYGVKPPDPVPVAQPPGSEDEGHGEAPDWGNCSAGMWGEYSNLGIEIEGLEAPADPSELDWWEQPAFEAYDPVLEFGEGWWPVDEGFEDDPAFFAVRWRGWLRVWDRGEHEVVVGAADDLWVYVGDELVLSMPGPQGYAPEEITLSFEQAGQFPLTVLFAQRNDAQSGLRFRPLGEGLSICAGE